MEEGFIWSFLGPVCVVVLVGSLLLKGGGGGKKLGEKRANSDFPL